jgi:hypothetical protein
MAKTNGRNRVELYQSLNGANDNNC